MLAIDLGLVNRKAHVISVREALTLTAVVCACAIAFNVLVWYAYNHHLLGLGVHVDRLDGRVNTGHIAALKFFTAYLVELSLSADNVFVMAMIFAHLRIPPIYQHRVLFWGILGALVMRGLMIVLGATLVARYHWILYIFGVFLIYTAYKMLRSKDAHDVVTEEAFVITQLRRIVPITGELNGPHFVSVHDGVRMLTPLAVALVLIEAMDLVFALDSIPATFAITADPFLVFTSNVFAILGLRSLYFVLAGIIERFRYLKVSLSAILGLIGFKMLLGEQLHELMGANFNLYLLGVVALILLAGVLASVRADRRTRPLSG
ncbi:MAG: putative membrane-bound redox modulator Alx [Gemmatimonadaceae bacterium]|nr:putative membrane-bound redox modulator Alx [Gemmatimonadaceae bacterium]